MVVRTTPSELNSTSNLGVQGVITTTTYVNPCSARSALAAELKSHQLLTSWPPKRFTPKYFGNESRPLRYYHPPSLCAMMPSISLEYL